MRPLVLIAVLVLAACEVADGPAPSAVPERAPESAVQVNEMARQAAAAGIGIPEGFDLRRFQLEALDLTDDELEAMRLAAVENGATDLYLYALALQAHGDTEALFELLDAIAPHGNEDNYRFVAATLLEDWMRYPDRLVRIGEHAHRAGRLDMFLMLADWASDPEVPIDPYDRLRLGRMLAGIQRADSFEQARHLGYLFYDGNEALGLAPDPARGAEFMEMAALAGDHEQALEVGRVFFEGDGVPMDLERAYDTYTHAGDKGNEFGYNNAAWILAVCPGFSAGERMVAMERIERGIAEHGTTSTRMDTLAAVHARLGNHHEAAMAQQQALALFEEEGRDPADFPDMERRLGLYQQGRAYNEPACHTRPGT